MKTVRTKIPADVLAILARATITGNVLVLPDQLDRETYLRVAKTLTAARGKWDRKARGHMFAFDPRELMADAVETGTVVDAKKTMQFFETPAVLARRMADLAQIAPGNKVLEPSAGLGRLVNELLAARAEVRAIEVEPANVNVLRELAARAERRGDGSALAVNAMTFEDFHAFAPTSGELFDAVVMNPPFSHNRDILHIPAAWDHLAPGGRLVAICSEGPFFRQDSAAAAFREWLGSVNAYTEKLPPGTFRESGTDVATRLIVATAPGTRPEHVRDLEPEPEATVRNIALREIDPDPDQPRKTFARAELSELAASIRANGLLQPITVREGGPNGYLIVAGERRYRAHMVNRSATIRVIVIETTDTADVRIKQIIENDQRADVPPLEQARSYQALMDAEGWTPAELGQRIGKAAHRVTERTDLLKIAPEYQHLLASGNLRPSEGTELARLSPRGQTTLFNAIRAGSCKSYGDLRASATALVNAEAQLTLMPPDGPPPPSDEDRRLATAFEANVDRIALMLRTGIHDNQIVAVRKVSPHRAGNLADLFGQMQKDLRRIEIALREAAIQESFLAA
jgi:ParB/RepB/Spo0J family partition protein